MRIFLIEYTTIAKSLNIEESLVLDLKILMYRNVDEIDKIRRIKADSDKEMAIALQQLKELSESRDLMQQELEELRELKVVAQAVVDVVEIPEGNRSRWRGGLRKFSNAFSDTSPRPPDST